ncbi:methyltransferase domain-containing protein [Thalassospiraceae bacterium LMO-JJ14]|nr:methyltransferase domain-containing protein [Thalassospiraceae bacterium LMO-JJ14]
MKRCLSCNHLFDSDDWTCPACGVTPETIDGFNAFAPQLVNTTTAFDDDSFGDLAESEESSFWYVPRNNLIAWTLGKYFPDATSFYEMGCGTGIVLMGLHEKNPALRLSGSDIYTSGLEVARDRLGDGVEQLLQTDAHGIPFREQFDAIGAFDVIEHIDDDVGAMHELLQTLKPGGGAIFVVPRHMFMWSIMDDLACHKRRYGRQQFDARVKQAGFEIVRTFSFGMLTLPLQYFSRKVMQKFRKGDKMSDYLELKVSPLTGFILRVLFELDQIPVRLGVNYPFGASLVVVARRPK